LTPEIEATADCRAVVVDMPIGLPSGCEPRLCDVAAREALGREGHNRVFMTPPRATLNQITPEEFQESHRRLTGRGAGLPVWGIVPRLKEVDAAMTPALQEHVREYHPELAWKRLADRVLPSKHTGAGFLDRLRVLMTCGVNVLPKMEDPPQVEYGIDDYLDAVVGLHVAAAIAEGEELVSRFPEHDEPCDEKGLRMEIWY
jgi:predicted RNase H-like nuclease